MSALQKELLKAAGLDAGDFKTRADMHAALVKKINDVDDKTWNGLSVKAQDWFNDAADAVKAKKTITEFPDYEPEPEPETRSRRRSADPEPSADEKPSVEKLEEGQRVKITTKRGRVYEGEVVENNKRKEFVAVKGADGEDEIDYDKIDALEVFHGTAAGQATDEPDAGPAVGDVVEFTTKRGKNVKGEVTELTEDIIVIDKEDDYDLAKIDGDIKIVKKGKAPAAEPETRGRRSNASDDDKGNNDKGGDEKKRSGNPRGVSVGGRIRELMGEDPDMSEEAVGKVLKKEGIEFRDNTLGMIYKDCTFLIEKLRAGGHMKKAK